MMTEKTPELLKQEIIEAIEKSAIPVTNFFLSLSKSAKGRTYSTTDKPDTYSYDILDFSTLLAPLKSLNKAELIKSLNKDYAHLSHLSGIEYQNTELSILEKYTSLLQEEDGIPYFNKKKYNIAVDEATKNSGKMLYLMIEVTGIFDHMFNLPQKDGALKRLRGRSYSCILITKAIAFYILNILELPKSNLLDEGGEIAGLLLRQDDFERVKELIVEIKESLIEKYNGSINILYAYKKDITINDLENNNTLLEELNELLYKNELYQFKDIALLLKEDTLIIEGEADTCNYCGRDYAEPNDKHICNQCQQEFDIGNEIAKAKYLISAFGKDLNCEKKAVTFFNDKIAYFFCRTKDKVIDYINKIKDYAITIDIASINDTAFFTSYQKYNNCSLSFMTIGNAAPLDKEGRIIDLDKLEERSNGASYIAALKIDVDNFGSLTSSSGLLKTIILSSYFKYFFQGYLDKIIEDQCCYTIYSGGDDLFLIGPWDKILELATIVNRDFRKYTLNTIHITGGMVVLSRAATIPSISELIEAAEKNAKKTKDCLSVFGRVYKWDEIDRLFELIFETFINASSSCSDENRYEYKEPFGSSFIHDLFSMTKKIEKGDLTAIPKICFRMRDNAKILFNRESISSLSLYDCLLDFHKNSSEEKFKLFHFIANYCSLITRKKREVE